MLIEIHPDALSLNGNRWSACPALDAIVATLGDQEIRVIRKSPALPRLIVDALGIAFRFSESNRRVHSLLLYFSVDPTKENPKSPFPGTVTLNGTKVHGHPRVADILKTGSFIFDDRPEPVAIGSLISVRLVRTGEYLAVMDVGWEDFVRYGWG